MRMGRGGGELPMLTGWGSCLRREWKWSACRMKKKRQSIYMLQERKGISWNKHRKNAQISRFLGVKNTFALWDKKVCE